MRNVVAGLVLGAMVLGQAVPSRAAATPGEDIGLAFAAAGIDVFYVPTKFFFAASGLVAGAVVGLFTGGDVRSAYAIWVPAAGGTFFVTPAHLDGTQELEFIGSDYIDRPSQASRETDSSAIYEATYNSR